MDRRAFLSRAAATGVAAGLGPGFWRAALAGPAQDGPGPYGELLPPDANGVQLPPGFTSRIVAVSGEEVVDSGYVWHGAPDGAATFPAEDGGWYLAVNSERIGPPGSGTAGGVGTLRFDADGNVVDAYRILDDTQQNCAGGATPWGTWLSCEEIPAGNVFECDPTRPGTGTRLPLLGTFSHEAVAVDPERQRLYLTEDLPTGHYYRFTPIAYPDLTAGTLEAALLDDDGVITWIPVPGGIGQQATAASIFNGGEGIWYDAAGTGYCYFTTKGDNFVWVHDLEADRITPLYEGDGVLTGVDNIVVHDPSGDLFVGEDGGNLEVVIISADKRELAPVVRLPGEEHAGSEITGPCFSPDGTRLYFSSQRGGIGAPGSGVTFEVTGPFRMSRAGIAALGADGAPEALPRPEDDPPSQQPATSAAPAPSPEPLPATGGGAVAIGAAAIGAAAALRRRTDREGGR